MSIPHINDASTRAQLQTCIVRHNVIRGKGEMMLLYENHDSVLCPCTRLPVHVEYCVCV